MALGGKTLQDLVAPISAQLGHATVAESVEVPASWGPVPVRATDGLSQDALVDMFVAEAEKIRVDVRRCAADGLAACIAAVVADAGQDASVVLASETRFEQAGVERALWDQPNVTDVHVWDPALGAANVELARTALFGVTYGAAGIAETATIAQVNTAQCGRAVSLLPLHHIAVVDASSIVGTLGEVLAGFEAGGQVLPSQLCFISGPSATADIELVRVEGVHGPMYVHYVLVE